MTQARVNLLIRQPFFGTLALYLELIEDSTLVPPTMAVDGRHIFYHPTFVNECMFQEVVFVVAHEVMHCVLNHTGRRGNRDPIDWNIAGDYAINLILKEAGFTMPASGGLLDHRYEGMPAEQIYELLPHRNGKGRRPGLYDMVRDAPKDSPPGENDPHAMPLDEQWKNAVIQAANAAKGAGKLAGSLERLVGEMSEVKTEWRYRLRHFATEESKNDYSYMRLNKKMMCMGYSLPGLYSESMGTMVIVTDDSGSIGNHVLSVFGAEIASIRDAVRPQRTIVLSCDARINHIDDLGEYDDFSLRCHGGGGTDFRPPFDWLQEQGIEPACLIYLTDLCGPFPKSPPSYPVLWCSINKQQAPWGETLHVEV